VDKPPRRVLFSTNVPATVWAIRLRLREDDMVAAIKAGMVYFAVVFAAGFALGVVRVLYVIPRLGETRAVLIEVPLMLALSWWMCGAVIRHFSVPKRTADRAMMCATALVLLMLGELAVAMLAFGRSAAEFLNSLANPNGTIGLAGQMAFVLFPLIRKDQ
jgi:hypothetical protein